MLYDPRWNDKVACGISLRGLIAWLETQDPEQAYDYTDPYNCVLAQYLQSFGLRGEDCAICFGENPDKHGPDAWLHFVAYGCNLTADPNSERTFGAALARARTVL